MKNTILIGSIIALLGIIFITSTYASGGFKRNTSYTPGMNTSSETFVDADNDGMCDNYANRPHDGTGRHYGRNR